MIVPADEGQRRGELATGLERLRHRLDVACTAAGRSPDEITLVAVTKTFPAADIRLLVQLGVADIGENRDQEARRKVAELADAPVRWHFVGQLQSNKASSVARYASVVHSVDRPRLVAALALGAASAGRAVTCLVQVDLDDPLPVRRRDDAVPAAQRGGAPPDEVPALADTVASADGLELGGVMAVAPAGCDPRAAFTRLAEVAAAVRRAHPAATIVSAGMSLDLEQAVACGATHVRVGSALLGSRPAVR